MKLPKIRREDCVSKMPTYTRLRPSSSIPIKSKQLPAPQVRRRPISPAAKPVPRRPLALSAPLQETTDIWGRNTQKDASVLGDAERMSHTISAGSHNNYIGKLNRLLRWHKQQNPAAPAASLGWRLFIDFLLVDTAHSSLQMSTLHGMFSAVKWHHRVYGIRSDTAQEEYARDAMRSYGIRFPHVHIKRERGGIDGRMLGDFLAWGREQGMPRALQEAFIFQWAGGFRSGQMRDLRRGHFALLENGGVMFYGAKHKDTKRSKRMGAADVESHTLEPSACRLVRHVLKRSDDKFSRPFDWFDSRVANGWIKRAATALGWDTDLVWSGCHNLRHGVAIEVMKRKDSVHEVQATLGHRHAQTSAHYARQGEVRKRAKKEIQARVSAPVARRRQVTFAAAPLESDVCSTELAAAAEPNAAPQTRRVRTYRLQNKETLAELVRTVAAGKAGNIRKGKTGPREGATVFLHGPGSAHGTGLEQGTR